MSRLVTMRVQDLLDAVASDTPTPGGGSASGDDHLALERIENTEGESGGFPDLGNQRLELFVKAGRSHGAISKLGPPPSWERSV